MLKINLLPVWNQGLRSLWTTTTPRKGAFPMRSTREGSRKREEMSPRAPSSTDHLPYITILPISCFVADVSPTRTADTTRPTSGSLTTHSILGYCCYIRYQIKRFFLLSEAKMSAIAPSLSLFFSASHR
jgi:hypothetical protein